MIKKKLIKTCLLNKLLLITEFTYTIDVVKKTQNVHIKANIKNFKF